ncbi:MAG: hypothetical protein QG632_419 [Candidatus Dependentiae bacterium]|nr:hypothetical protein [Candidatus Dependentiae bacterium]
MSKLIKLFVCFFTVGCSAVAGDIFVTAQQLVGECQEKYDALREKSPCLWGKALAAQGERLHEMKRALSHGKYQLVREHFVDFSFAQLRAVWELSGSDEMAHRTILRTATHTTITFLEKAREGESIIEHNAKVLSEFYTLLNKALTMYSGMDSIIFSRVDNSRRSVESLLRQYAGCED